jgi:hypothetical protein
MISREVTTAAKLAAFSRKQTPMPTVAMRTPPMAGPTAGGVGLALPVRSSRFGW